MTLSIQRPPDAVAALVHRFDHPQPPLNSQLTVAADECVVVASNGVVLGLVQPGVYWLHPQPLPFLASVIVGGNAVQAELWFVRTIPMMGIRFGGALPAFVEPGTNVQCTGRVMGDFSIAVRDPARVVTACVGASFTDAEPLLAWVKQVVMRQLGGALEKEVAGGKSLLARDLMPGALDRVAGELGELESSGLAVTRFGDVMLNFPEDDVAALRDAKVQAALAKGMPPARTLSLRCSKCSKPHEGGRFCVDCGGALANG